MKPISIKPGIFKVGAIDWDRRLFDSLIPLPDGTSYNSYLVQGSEKTVLIDTVDPPLQEVLLEHLRQSGVKKIDYVVTHHGEQDHSGATPAVLKQYPQATVLASPKCKTMLMDLLHVPEKQIREVQDGEVVSLGNRTLKFIYTPWVHWPETMVTYLIEEKMLFSCDFFGSHIATTDLYVTDKGRVEEAAKRYFAEIMMPFRSIIKNNLEKLKDYQIEIIAPSHGPMYNRPDFILNLYREWVADEPKNIVLLPFVSMHGSTLQMVRYLTEALEQKGIEVKQFDLPATDIGKLAMSLVDAATLVLGTPTVLAGPHPAAVYAAFLANALRPKLKYASIIGSDLWGGKTIDVIKSLLPNLKVELFEPVIARGLPRESDFAKLQQMADNIVEKHKLLKA